MPQVVSESDVTITAGKNKLANVCIYGQIKANDVFKEIPGQLPNNAKQLSRELIAAAARVLRPDTSPELVRDILHYRSRKVRCIYKDWKCGKLSGDTPLDQRLIDCEKALLNTLELGVNMPSTFLEQPDINSRSMEIISHMHAFIMDPNFRLAFTPSLPPLAPQQQNHQSPQKPSNEHEMIGGSENGTKDQQEESEDGDSVHASSSSSFENQCCPQNNVNDTQSQLFNLNYPVEQLHAAFLNSAANSLQNVPLLSESVKSVQDSQNRRSSLISGTTTTGSSLNNGTTSNQTQNSTKTMAGRKRKYEGSQFEIIEMKKDLIRLQQMAFERQIQMCDEIVGMLKEMRGWMDIQKRSLAPQNTVNSLQQQLNSMPNSLANYSLLPNQLSTNLSTLSSLLANATAVTSPQFM